jgi:tRNA (guanine37-N1)-methyltransferase
MNIHILTLFPGMFKAITAESIIKRAQQKGMLSIKVYNIRDYAADKHRKVDARPFGGGPGMVMQCEPVINAICALKRIAPLARIILMGPGGKLLNHKLCQKISQQKDIIILCGHYEGLDDRIRDFVSQEISIGDYVLTGGEIPAMVLIDSVARLIHGVLGDEKSKIEESFTEGLLEYPHYTRPSNYKGKKVPDVLLSGNHNSIKAWRKRKSIGETMRKRPDLIRHINQLEM